MLKTPIFNLIKFLFIQFDAGLPGCPQASTRPVAHPQHLRAVGFELLHPQPADALQLRQALGCGLGNGGQRRVVEDHIRGQVVFFGHFGAPGLEVDEAHHRVLPQVGGGGGWGAAAAGAFVGALAGAFAQPDVGMV